MEGSKLEGCRGACQESNHLGQKDQAPDHCYASAFPDSNPIFNDPTYLSRKEENLLASSPHPLPLQLPNFLLPSEKQNKQERNSLQNPSRARAPMADLENPWVVPKVVTFLSSLLQRVTDSNDSNQCLRKQRTSAFHGLTRPSISLHSYLERIFKYANCSPSCYVVAYIYLDRFSQRRPSLLIDSFNVHRLLITSVVVAAKFMDDIHYSNAYYARVGGISTVEMNFLELDFLFSLGFHLFVTPTNFHTYCCYLQRETMLLEPLPPIPTITLRSLKLQQCFLSEDESTAHKKQLAV